jgi:class 3 adenylate cyclase
LGSPDVASASRLAGAAGGDRCLAVGLGGASGSQGGLGPVLDTDGEPGVRLGRDLRRARPVVAAAIPFAYQVASAVSIYTFARTRRYRLFRSSQLWMSLLLPFALQWSLGGFATSSAVALWAVTCPLGALLFVGARQSVPWFGAFVGLVAVSGVIDPTLADRAPHIPNGVVVTFFALNIVGVATTAYALLQYFVRARERALAELAREHRALEREQAKSERLLLNVLPEPVAARLKEKEGIIADAHLGVTVLFADIVGFTPLSERLSAPDVVALLDRVFARWDALAASHGVEKIKTIGDAYMAAGGIPFPRADPPKRSPSSRSRYDPNSHTPRRRRDWRSRCGSASTPALSSPASSAERSSSTTFGATPSIPPAGWNPTPLPAPSKSRSGHMTVCGSATSYAHAARSRSRAKDQ